MLRLVSFYALTTVAIFFAGCEETDEGPKGDFVDGVLIVNEGNFGKGNGTISHFNRSTKEVQHDVFGTVNSGKALGDIVQSMFVWEDKAYIVVNNSNRVVVANANTLEEITTISNLSLPRFMTVANGRGYVTEWVNFVDRGRVSVINLQTYAVETTIQTGKGPEEIISLNGRVYVSNSFENTVTVINPSTNQVVSTIQVGASPSALLVDNQNKLWIVCEGGYDQNFNLLNNGSIVNVEPASNAVVKTINLNKNVSGGSMLQGGTDLIYFSGKVIYRVATNVAQPQVQTWITENSSSGFYGLGVDNETGEVYAGDNNFVSNSTVFRYSANGSLIDTFQGGIGVNGFVFR